MTIGTIINHRYRIVELIGAGGMAQVYRAMSISNEREVAIKVLREEFRDNPEFLRRFEREARAVLHLSHDNIVRAYGIGQYDGIPYIVMEYVPGKTLKQLIQETGRLPVQTAMRFVCQILDALSAAHAIGIIHRDVKPQNVIVTAEGDAKLTDFGIARDVEANTMTFAGDTVIGSVHYLSPEQATGAPVNAASDIYSAGIILYEMLTGDIPFTGETSVSIALKHINDMPTEPIQLNSEISPALNGIIMRALKKAPAERYTTAKAMRNDLLRVQYDPTGAFLRIPAEPSEQIKGMAAAGGRTGSKRWHGSVKIALVISLCICALLGTFFGIRSLNVQTDTSVQPAPYLTGKTIADATQKTSGFGLTLVVTDYIASDELPYGSIVSQVPEAGAPMRSGSSISVVVSVGPESPMVPQLVGLTYDEALAVLHNTGMKIGKVSYRVSDTSIGYICEQWPAEGDEVASEGLIDICISATSASLIEMPTLTGLPLREAMQLLDQNGFSDILIRFEPTLGADNEMVVQQAPDARGTVQNGIRVSLTVSGDADDRPYRADLAYNMSISDNATTITVTLPEVIEGMHVERVVYEGIFEKSEMVPVVFSVFAASEGLHELIVYQNGTEVRRQEISFE